MKVSYNWLQSYFKDPLPTPEKLAELFTFRFAEVESIEKIGDDTVLDVKVLPDRAHYALCHRGIAREVAAVTGNSIVIPGYVPKVAHEKKVAVSVENKALCSRYTARYIEEISVAESPAWLEDRLLAIGQRPINCIVDAANFIMFDMGQPLHAFDADKVAGQITVRMAQDGESITTLDGKEVMLRSDILVIADEKGPLAIAGIKGGTRAIVDEKTTRIILESAHFDPAYVRKASGIVGIRTDASKRYENEITPEWTVAGSDLCAALIAELCPNALVGALTDTHPEALEQRVLSFDPAFASAMLGESITEEEILRILGLLNIAARKEGNSLTLTIPPERLDLVLPEDIAEEIGRIHGYENIPPVAPPKLAHTLPILKHMYYEERIRDTLVAFGFSEIFTYSFTKTGVHEVEKSLASDKNFLRASLRLNMIEALERNAHNADLIGIDDVKMFEIGKVFGVDGERLKICIGMRKIKKQKGSTSESLLAEIASHIDALLGRKLPWNFPEQPAPGLDATAEALLDEVFDDLPAPTAWNLIPYKQENSIYKKISQYPFVVRDIAMFVPVETAQEDVAGLLKAKAGELLATIRLFDIFTKTFPDGSQKTSYAFRLVFQSHEKTLSDEDILPVMECIAEALQSKGWEIR